MIYVLMIRMCGVCVCIMCVCKGFRVVGPSQLHVVGRKKEKEGVGGGRDHATPRPTRHQEQQQQQTVVYQRKTEQQSSR